MIDMLVNHKKLKLKYYSNYHLSGPLYIILILPQKFKMTSL